MANDIKISKAGRQEIKRLALPECLDAAEKIAQACNAQSSWGGYKAIMGSSAAVVLGYTHEANVDNARAQRILRNVNAGRS